MSASTEAARAHDDVVRVSTRALPPLELLARVAERIRGVVPYDGAGWLVADPATGLNTGVVPVNVDGPLHLRLIESEIVDDDVNKFRSIARSRSPVALLNATTEGDLSHSARHRKLYAPNGYGDELRAVFRTGSTVWGQVCMSRREDQPAFTAAEARLVRRVATHVGHGLRTGQLLAAAADGVPTPPGVVLLDAADQVLSMTDPARELLDDVPTPGTELPVAVYEVAQRARVLADGDTTGPPATARVAASPDRWLVLHGSYLGAGRTVVVVERARRAELASLIVEAYGLTVRERQVTELWVQGLDVTAVARVLVISPHTVHDHVKAVYRKMSVTSRPELVATLFYEHVLPG